MSGNLTEAHWYMMREDETVDDVRDRRLRECPILSPAELEVLLQCRRTIWDGYVCSKSARDSLCDRGFITRCQGWQVVTQEGMAILDTLGYMKCAEWGVNVREHSAPK